MKKYSVMAALFLAAAVTAGTLTGCGGSSSGKPAGTTAAGTAAAETRAGETAAETTATAAVLSAAATEAETAATAAVLSGTAAEEETGGTEAADSAPSAAADADSDWYMKVLDDTSLRKEYPYYFTADVNGDGVPVLFLSSTENSFIGAEDKGCMIVCHAGDPKTLKEVGEAGGDKFYWNPEEHTITWYHRLSGESHIEVYALKDGELETITTADSYGPHHYPEKDNPEQLYFQDGNEISAGEIEALWDAYANDADVISYSK